MSYGVLQHLFDSLAAEARCNTVTPADADGVTPKPAPLLACTPVTPVTPHIVETGVRPVRLYRLTPAQGDRCHSPCWDDAEISTFVSRHARLLALGFTDGDADDLAERLTLRDRDCDDRRVCVECAHYAPQRCGAHRAAGLQSAEVGRDLATRMQHCQAWATRETP
ncbi:MAG: hypothetical protein Q8M01_04355 [Rubrivivax sp.]|nr:hypothetical protein [Rubrivivax sp.]